MQTGTLEELGVEPGDVVEDTHDGMRFYVRRVVGETVVGDTLWPDDGESHKNDTWAACGMDTWRIVSRASGKPKRWKDMTDEEKGALLLARYRGKVIETRSVFGWLETSETPAGVIEFSDNSYYRVKPEPVRHTVTLYCDGTNVGMDPFPIGTIELVDGEPDFDSIIQSEVDR